MTKVLCLCVLLATAGCSTGNSVGGTAPLPTPVPSPAFPAATVARLDAAVSRWMSSSKAPGVVVGIWIPGEGTYVTTRGTANLATGDPMLRADHFRIGSNTKTFVGTVLLQLAGDKTVGLDDPVSKYVSYVPNGNHITLRMLANMTSGLFNYTEDAAFVKEFEADPYRVWKPRELLAVGLSGKPYFPPGTGFHYSNTNTVLLGVIIEQITHQSIAAVFSQRFFKPLGMQHTVWPTGGAIPAPYAHGITTQTPDGHQADATHWNPSWAFTAGALISTLDDMHLWVDSYAGTLVTPAMQKQRFRWVTFPPLSPEHAYGIGIAYNNGWVGHEGALPGYNTGGYYLASKHAALVMLVNSDIGTSEGSLVGTLFRAIAKIVTPANVPVK